MQDSRLHPPSRTLLSATACFAALVAMAASGWLSSAPIIGWVRPQALVLAFCLAATALCLTLESSANPGESRSPLRFTAAFYLLSAVLVTLHHRDDFASFLTWSGGALAASGLARALWSAESARPGASPSSAAGLILLLLGVLMLAHWPAWCWLVVVPLQICDLLLMTLSGTRSAPSARPAAAAA